MATSESSSGGFNFQGLLDQLTRGSDGSNNGGGVNLQDIISQVTRGAQQNQEPQTRGGVGITDLIKVFLNSALMSVFVNSGFSRQKKFCFFNGITGFASSWRQIKCLWSDLCVFDIVAKYKLVL